MKNAAAVQVRQLVKVGGPVFTIITLFDTKWFTADRKPMGAALRESAGNAALVLKFTNGETREYSLDYVNEQTLLNGTRYFRTYDANCQ